MQIRRHVGVAAAVVISVVGSALPALTAHADTTTLYVNNNSSSNCSDGGTGTQAQPFCTIQAAANAALPGQTVQIAKGKYPEQVTVPHSGTQGNPIVFKGIGHLAVVGVPVSAASAATTGHGFVLSGVHDVTVQGLAFGTLQEALLVADSDRIVLDGNALRGSGITAPSPGIRLTGRTTATTVSRNFVLGSGGAGIVVDPGVAGAVVTTNALTANPGGGIRVTDAPGTVVTSNTAAQNCVGGITLAGNSAGSMVENNILTANQQAGTCTNEVDLAVSTGSITGTKADYNVVRPATGGVSYAWGATNYATPADFNSATAQGAHDNANDPKIAPENWAFTPQAVAGIVDAADTTAPGELDTDVYGNPRVRDPQIASTGTGAGYYDRGAIEVQDPLTGWVSVTPRGAGYPLDIQLSGAVGTPWGLASANVDFGDGTTVPLLGSPMDHSYQGPGTYTVTVTATGVSGGVRTWTQPVTIAPVGPIQVHPTTYGSNCPIPSVAFGDTGSTSPWPIARTIADFGDGTAPVVTNGPTPPTDIPHDYATPGTYTVTETVVDDHGRTGSASVQLGVSAPAQSPVPPAGDGRVVEAVEGGTLHEIFPDSNGEWCDHHIVGVGGNLAAPLGFSYSPSGMRVVEAVENGALHEMYSDSNTWHDNAVLGAGGNINALGFSYSPSGARVVEATENYSLHEIYSDPSGYWHDGQISGVDSGYVRALGFSYSPSGARVIEAVEGQDGVLHEIYSDPSGYWHDNPIAGVGHVSNAIGFAYSPSGARVIEAVENGVLHEIYSDPNGYWHDNPIPGISGSPSIAAVSVKVQPSGTRLIEAVEANVPHEISSDPSGNWHDSVIPASAGPAEPITGVSVDLH